jgi:hypothetical protein
MQRVDLSSAWRTPGSSARLGATSTSIPTWSALVIGAGCEINHRHSALPNPMHQLLGSEPVPGQRIRSSRICGGCARLVMGRKQGFDLLTQRLVSTAGLRQEGTTLRRIMI